MLVPAFQNILRPNSIIHRIHQNCLSLHALVPCPSLVHTATATAQLYKNKYRTAVQRSLYTLPHRPAILYRFHPLPAVLVAPRSEETHKHSLCGHKAYMEAGPGMLARAALWQSWHVGSMGRRRFPFFAVPIMRESHQLSGRNEPISARDMLW